MVSNFPKGWALVSVNDCMSAVIDYRGKSPQKSQSGIPLITAKIVKRGRILSPEEFIAPENYEQWMRRGIPQAGDIVLTTEAPLGEVAQLDGSRAAFAQRLIILRGKVGLLDNNFLKFVLQSDLVQGQLRARATGTTVHGIRQSELRKIELPVPPLEEQRAIAHILGTTDDKIELNRRMNETLETMARALFKSWFVDFDSVRAKVEGRQHFGMDAETAALFPDSFQGSPLGKIPKGWRVGRMAELVSLSREVVNPGDSPDEVFDHYSIPAFDEGQWPKEETGHQIKSNKFLVSRDAVLLSKLNPRLARVWLPAVCGVRRSIASTEFLLALPQKGFSREYTFALLSSQEFLDVFESLVTGTSGSHQRVKPEFLLAMDVIVPSRRCVECFAHVVGPLYEKAAKNLAESRILAGIRDALLPKLISGEIRVNNAEKLAEKAV